VPPKQCPACGRFLKNAFVVGLDEAVAPCPGCGDELHAGMFASTASDPPVSVRPPDLEPASVRDTTRDVLVGWDVTADAEEIASWRRDRRPFPTDTVVVVGGGVLGAIAGGVLGRNSDPRHPVLGIVGGLTLGLTVAAATRRIWRLR
jgi:hypothetical protein